MSSVFGKLWTRLSSRRQPISIMIVGLDNSGKSCVLNSLISSVSGHGHRNEFVGNTPDTSPFSSRKIMTENDLSLENILDDRVEEQLLVGTESKGSTSKNTGTSFNLTKEVRLHTEETDFSGQFDNNSSSNIMPTIGYNYERIHYMNHVLTILDFSGQSRYRNLWEEFFSCIDAIVFVIDSSDQIRFVVARDELETLINHRYFSSLRDSRANSPLSKPKSPSSVDSQIQKQITISRGRLVQSPISNFPPNPQWPVNDSPPATNSFCRKSVSRKRKTRLRTKVPILFLANKADLINSADVKSVSQSMGLDKLPTERHPWIVKASSAKSHQGIQEGFSWLVNQIDSEEMTS